MIPVLSYTGLFPMYGDSAQNLPKYQAVFGQPYSSATQIPPLHFLAEMLPQRQNALYQPSEVQTALNRL
ncbi:hypothetical protein [uncultured Flavobacterium sp.]|uniref:hypothetical protein n=1 Tax=uncultured Flavobacterium sp. TaxID=165435 RepID=UPI0025FF74BA|nr:hypothetical protein [uncultured Flavobacterium sp.]